MAITKKRIERKEKPLYNALIFSIAIFLTQQILFPVIIINDPYYPNLYLLVLLLTTISLYITKNKYLLIGYSVKDNLKTRLAVLGINSFKYFVGFAIIYFCLFVFSFNIYVKYFSTLGPTEYYTIPITQVNSGTGRSSPSIGFYFKGKYNSLTISGSTYSSILKVAKDRFHTNTSISIECRKSVFDCYLLDQYQIIQP